MHPIWRKVAIFLILFLSVPLSAQPGKWKLTATIPEINLQSQQLFFPDSLNGYLFGWKKLKYANPTYEDAILYRTIDGGITWQKIDFRNILGADTALYSARSGNSSYLRFDASSQNSCVISNSETVQSTDDPLAFYWSDNNGISWFRTRNVPLTSRGKYLVEGTPHAHEIAAIAINHGVNGDSTSGKFYESVTKGAIFDDIRWDSTLLQNILGYSVKNHTFDFFDDFTWIVTVSSNANSFSPNLSRPYILTTLLAKDLDSDSDPGSYWEAYYNTIPDFPSDYQAKYFDSRCVRGTEAVYLFSGYGGEGQYPFYGINYLYSTDQGRTWDADSSFVIQGNSYRRAYAASSPNEVWHTVIPSYATIYPNTPAVWIAHSSDFGKQWSIDSLSLHPGENVYYDGRTITFSDPNHGWMYAQSVDGTSSAIFRYISTTDAVHHETESEILSYSLFPNPTITESAINISGDLPILDIGVYDLLGRKLHADFRSMELPSSAILGTNTLPRGSYLLRIRNSERIQTIPFVVNH